MIKNHLYGYSWTKNKWNQVNWWKTNSARYWRFVQRFTNNSKKKTNVLVYNWNTKKIRAIQWSGRPNRILAIYILLLPVCLCSTCFRPQPWFGVSQPVLCRHNYSLLYCNSCLSFCRCLRTPTSRYKPKREFYFIGLIATYWYYLAHWSFSERERRIW